MINISKFLEKHFNSILILGMIIPFFSADLFIFLNNPAEYFLMISLFLGALKLNFSELKKIQSGMKKLLLFIFISLIVVPICTYAITLPFSTDIQIGFFLIMATSAGMAAPFIASKFTLKIVWVFAFTTITSLLVPFTLPFFIDLLWGMKIELSVLEMILFIGKIIFIPLGVSIIIKRFFTSFTKQLSVYSGGIGSINMFIFIALLIAPHTEYIINFFKTDPKTFVIITVFTILAFLINFLIGYILPANSSSERRTNSLMFGIINNGLVILIAAEFFSPLVVFITLITEIPWILSIPIFGYYINNTQKL